MATHGDARFFGQTPVDSDDDRFSLSPLSPGPGDLFISPGGARSLATVFIQRNAISEVPEMGEDR